MSLSAVLKKTLPVLIAFVLILVIGAIVTGVKGKEKVNPAISESDKIYLSLEEDGLTYKITRGEIYEELKLSVGTSALITRTNKLILSLEKNSEGVSYFDAVTEEAIQEEIKEAVFGEEDVEDLTNDEREEKIQDYLDSMFKSFGYKADSLEEEVIKDHYRLELAKEAYAKDQLLKTIAEADAKAENDEDSDPYFDEDTINDYYSDNYYKSYWGIIVPFGTKAEAENALQQLGVAIDTAKDVWCHVEYNETEVGSGIYERKLGDPLTPSEVIDTFVKLYNLVYSHKAEAGKTVLTEGVDFTKVDLKAEVTPVRELASALVTKYEAKEDVTQTVADIKTAIAALETKMAELGYSSKALTTSLESFEKKLTAANEASEADKESLTKNALDQAKAFKSTCDSFSDFGYVFDTTNEESPLFYDYEKLSGYNSTLPNKFNNTYTVYRPFNKVEVNASTNTKPTWYTHDTLSLSSSAYYVFVLKLDEIAIPELNDELKAEIVEKLTEKELTAEYTEEKVAQLRENYSLVIYDEKVELSYNESMSNYGIEREATKDSSEDKIAKFTHNTYKKVEVSSKKEFRKARKANDGIYVYNNGLYEEVEKYQEGQVYYVREVGESTEISVADFFNDMDSLYGMTLALSEITYRRFLYNEAFNVYKDMNTGEWKDTEKRDEFIEDIETQRVNFLAGGYASYGYDPTVMTWEEFMVALYGAKNEQELADSFLYSDIVADYTEKLNFITEKDDEGNYVNKNYTELLASKLWGLYVSKMENAVKEYFNVTGIHFLVSTYEDPSKANDKGTPLNPEEWTNEQKEAAKELIKDVQNYLVYAKGDYETVLTDIANAFKACPYEVNGETPVIYDEDGNAIDYTLTAGEATIDVAHYKTLGLFVKFEDLGSFANGTMVEAFNDAVKAIWDKDIQDEVYSRVTILEDAIETEFGYHLYINLGSTALPTYESNLITPDAEGNWIDEDGKPLFTVEGEETKTEERVLPQLYEVLLYVKDANSEHLSAGAKTAVETYYKGLADEIGGSYFSYMQQYLDVKDLLTDSSVASGNYDKADLERVIALNIEAWYEANIKLLEAGDELVIRESK